MASDAKEARTIPKEPFILDQISAFLRDNKKLQSLTLDQCDGMMVLYHVLPSPNLLITIQPQCLWSWYAKPCRRDAFDIE